MSVNCPLCSSENSSFYTHQTQFTRDWYLCRVCDLRFVRRDQLLDLSEEKKRYSSHQNDIRSVGYEAFLRRLINPIIELYPKDVAGLDYGSGPYPMLIEILEEEGFTNIEGFDPIFNNNEAYLSKKYDFITMCEVIEHIYDLKSGLIRLSALLMFNGRLIISTGIYNSTLDFHNWHYIKDDTHINIFSQTTLEWISKAYKLKLERIEKDLVIYLKK